MTEESKYAATSWVQASSRDLTVPSGQLCQVRLPGVQAMIAAGVLESADTLTSMIDEKHIKRVSGRTPAGARKNVNGAKGAAVKVGDVQEIDTVSLMKDPENIRRVFALTDKVLCYMVLQPNIVMWEEGMPRHEGVIYADMIDLGDKMFIFQYAVGGSTDVESFREQFGEGLGGVAAQ